jgi:hypothetical protein
MKNVWAVAAVWVVGQASSLRAWLFGSKFLPLCHTKPKIEKKHDGSPLPKLHLRHLDRIETA